MSSRRLLEGDGPTDPERIGGTASETTRHPQAGRVVGSGSPPPIRQLPDHVANQIAAGEVIERPAAVVKELVENSIDAGATRIHIACEDGGRRLIEVVDNGHGMRAEDLRLAMSRHATSKLHDADDLFRIATLGFRGEALPSIAAVSEFEIASHPADTEAGQVLALSSGSETRFAPCAMAPGSRVSVRNLFWNVPVRLKFLKSEASEAGHVTEQVIRLALGHPHIGFRCDIGTRTALDLAPGHDLPLRIREIFGKRFADGLLPATATADRLQVAGFVAHPNEARPSAKRQYIFLNGRYLRDKLLIAAVREGYKGFLEPRLHGACVLHLDIDPALVDVNVHPTKSEVRFRREGEVFATVVAAVAGALADHAGGFTLMPTGETKHSSSFARTVVTSAHSAGETPLIQERFLPQTPTTHRQEASAPPRDESSTAAVIRNEPTPADPASAGQGRRAGDAVQAYTAPTPAKPADAPHLPGVRRVVQLNNSYLLIETDWGIRLVDQHALHEKALFLSLDPARSDWRNQGTQQMLVPRPIELSAADIAAIEPCLPALATHGIQAEVFGPTTLLLRAHPAALKRTDWTAFFADLARTGDTERSLERIDERIAHSAACHAAVKAGQPLNNNDQLELVRLLYTLEGAEHCPHGRPTTLDLTWDALDRRFQR